MSSCKYMNCTSGCCNSVGTCPEDYSSAYYSSNYSDCMHYYNQRSINIGILIGAAIGGLWILSIIIAICCWYSRKKQATQALIQRTEEYLQNTLEKVGENRRKQMILMTEQPLNEGQLVIQQPQPMPPSPFLIQQSSINGPLYQANGQPTPLSYMQNKLPNHY